MNRSGNMVRLSRLLVCMSLSVGTNSVAAFLRPTYSPTCYFVTNIQLKAMSFNKSIVRDSKLPGNFNFDPLHFSQSRQQLVKYRQAEMKHARVAMLAVLAIMWSDMNMVDTIGATPIVEGRAFPEFLGACVGLPASLELYAEKIEQEHQKYIDADDDTESSYFPGHWELDPFHLYPAETNGQQRVQFAEIMTGRVCMVAAAMRLVQNGMNWMEDDQDSLAMLPSWLSEMASGTVVV